MEITFNSRKMGKEVTFWSNVDHSDKSMGYVWVDTNGNSGTLGVQCFDRNGNAESVSVASFESVCKSIYRKMVAEYFDY